MSSTSRSSTQNVVVLDDDIFHHNSNKKKNDLAVQLLFNNNDIVKTPLRSRKNHPVSTEFNKSRNPKIARRSKSRNGSGSSASRKKLPSTISTKLKSSTSLLTRDEERQITYRIRDLRRVVRIRDELLQENEEHNSAFLGNDDDVDVPTEEDWAKACDLDVSSLRRVMSDGQEARSLLVSANAGLVRNIAKRHYYVLKQMVTTGGGVGTILTLQDMIQEGNLGLMKAAERYEPERGFRFSTYATYWIRQRILQSITDSSRVIRLPVHGTL